jgi:hypothetical protein
LQKQTKSKHKRDKKLEREINSKYHDFMKKEQERILGISKSKHQIPKLDLSPSNKHRSGMKKKYPPTDSSQSKFNQLFNQGVGNFSETESDTTSLLNQKNEIIIMLKKKNKRLKLQNKDLFSGQSILTRQIQNYEGREIALQKKYKKLKGKMHEVIEDFHELKDSNRALSQSLKRSMVSHSEHRSSDGFSEAPRVDKF